MGKGKFYLREEEREVKGENYRSSGSTSQTSLNFYCLAERSDIL